MAHIGDYVVPAVIVFVVVFGALKKVDLFDVFGMGAREGISSYFDCSVINRFGDSGKYA